MAQPGSDVTNVHRLGRGSFTVEETLQTGMDQENVIVISLTDHKMQVAVSGNPSVYEIIGLLERVKVFLVEQSREK